MPHDVKGSVSDSSFKILVCVRLQKLQTISYFGKQAGSKSLSEGKHFLTTDPNAAKAPRKEYVSGIINTCEVL